MSCCSNWQKSWRHPTPSLLGPLTFRMPNLQWKVSLNLKDRIFSQGDKTFLFTEFHQQRIKCAKDSHTFHWKIWSFDYKNFLFVGNTNWGFSHCTCFQEKKIQSLMKKNMNKECWLESKNKMRKVGKRTKIVSGLPVQVPGLSFLCKHCTCSTDPKASNFTNFSICRKATRGGDVSVWVVVEKFPHTGLLQLNRERVGWKKGSSSEIKYTSASVSYF